MPHLNLYSRFASVSLAVAGAAVALALLAAPAAQAQPQQPGWTGAPVPPPAVVPPDRRGDPGYGRPDHRHGPVVVCESHGGRYRECRTPFRGPAVLVRQLSDARCIPGRTYGSTKSGRIWVSKGCRGEFSPR